MARRPPPPTARTAAAVPDWDRFVERCGIWASLALMVAILGLTSARAQDNPMAEALAGPQLLLTLVIMGCIAVLSYRRDPS